VQEAGNKVGFIAAGDFGFLTSVTGVAVSLDNGATFTAYSADLQTDARYVAAPATDTWFVAGGQWPGESEERSPLNRTARFYLERMENGQLRPVLRTKPNDYSLAKGQWRAQVTKTTDGGSTWTTVFNSTGVFYCNGISFWNTQQGCFVGESDAGSAPGSRIWCTQNGGTTWNQTLFNSGPDYSLIDINAVPNSNGTAWAVGGDMSGFGTASFYVTTNYGMTWTLGGSIDGQYAAAIDCVSPSACWSPLLDVLTQEASVAGLS
jgi:hypothetical protein